MNGNRTSCKIILSDLTQQPLKMEIFQHPNNIILATLEELNSLLSNMFKNEAYHLK